MSNLPVENIDAIDPCPRCGARVPRVIVHGHYQCQLCRSNIDDRCQGEVSAVTGGAYWKEI